MSRSQTSSTTTTTTTTTSPTRNKCFRGWYILCPIAPVILMINTGIIGRSLYYLLAGLVTAGLFLQLPQTSEACPTF